MATSGTVTYRVTKDTLSTSAIRLCGGTDPENSAGPTATQLSNAGEAMNMMFKAWETQGIHLWERRWGVIFPGLNQGTFVLGSPGPAGDHACASSPLGSGYVQTTLSAAAASGATSITVTSVTGSLNTVGSPATSITDTYNIGIQLDDGTMQWTTVSGAPVGSVVTLAAALTGAASSGNYVYCYQTKLTRPMRILDGFCRQLANQNDVPCKIISREEYNRFGQKSSAGTPIQLYYDPQSNTGHLYTYPVFAACDKMLFVEFEHAIQDITGSADDFDLPQEWAEAIKYGLAWRIAPEYQVSSSTYKQLEEMAAFTLNEALGWDQDEASVQLQPRGWMYSQEYNR